MGVRLLVPGGGVGWRVMRCRGGGRGAGGQFGVHGVGVLEGEEVNVGGVHGHGVGLDAQVEEKLQDAEIFGQVVPGFADRHGWGRSHLPLLPLGEARVQGVLVELRQLLQGNGS